MLDDKQGIKKQHKPWELKKLSTSLYLTDSEENKIIPAVSQKGYTDLKKNVLQNSYYLFYRLFGWNWCHKWGHGNYYMTSETCGKL